MTTGTPDTPTILELYKICVEMADRTSGRRQGTNTFFVTLHSTLAVIVGVIGSVLSTTLQNSDKTSLLTLSAVGIVLSAAWWGLLRYYRRLNRAKFVVINDIETHFPVKPFTEEWAALHPTTSAPPVRWHQWIKKSRRDHREATLVEQLVPVVFATIYAILGLRVLFL